MNLVINETIEKLAKRIQEIIESDSGEELHLLPELVESLSTLISASSLGTGSDYREQLREDSKNLLQHP